MDISKNDYTLIEIKSLIRDGKYEQVMKIFEISVIKPTAIEY